MSMVKSVRFKDVQYKRKNFKSNSLVWGSSVGLANSLAQ